MLLRTLSSSLRNRLLIPKGLIIPFNSLGAIPTGWEAWGTAHQKALCGAGSTYDPLDTFGADTVSLGLTFTSAGAHTGVLANFAGTGAGTAAVFSSGSAGAHQHTITGDRAYITPRYTFPFIRATDYNTVLPIDGVVLAVSAVSGLANITITGNRLLSGNNVSLGNAGSNILTLPMSSSGSHTHVIAVQGCSGGGIEYAQYTVAGVHNPDATVTITPYIKRKLLSLWTNAAAAFGPSAGIIGMYESLSAPPGWALCDGTSGTPDLRDYFIQVVDDGSEDTTGTGGNTVDAEADETHSWGHTHQAATCFSASTANYHAYMDPWSHNHTAQDLAISYAPATVAVAFIMKL